MKSSKSSTILATGSRWVAPLLIAGGAVIGIALTWAVLISMESFQSDLINQPNQNRVITLNQTDNIPVDNKNFIDENSGIYPISTSSSVSLVDPEALSVDWTKPIELSRDQIFEVLKGVSRDPDALKKIISVTSTESIPPLELFDQYDQFTGIEKMWKQGTVKSGSLKGSFVYLVRILGYNMGPGIYLSQVVVSEDGLKLFGVSTGSDMEANALGVGDLGYQYTVKLSGTKAKQILKYHGRIIYLTGAMLMGSEYIFDTSYEHTMDPNPLIVTDEGVPLYQNINFGSGCLAAILDTGAVVYYTMEMSSQSSSDNESGIRWNRDYENTIKYVGTVFGGCGGGYCAHVVSSALVGDESDLVAAGVVVDSGDIIYAPKDPLNHPLVKEAYDQWYDPSVTKKPTIQEMLNQMKVPIFFWKDPIGRWVQYGAESLMPQAECGKPVIYLYPTTSTQVIVKLPSFINVTVSDPQYPVNGWSVLANPNGDLVSRDDGKMYGSLYWEGTGVGYQPPKTGFIVKDGSVSTFLKATLPKYGLNQKETKEFMDFWAPRMVGAPYYQISFLTSEWSKVAPLNVMPRPQTNIRIFMDWKPLSRSKSIKAPSIVTPVRNGFTLVEWGGLLYK